jgi:hypothetical protein
MTLDEQMSSVFSLVLSQIGVADTYRLKMVLAAALGCAARARYVVLVISCHLRLAWTKRTIKNLVEVHRTSPFDRRRGRIACMRRTDRVPGSLVAHSL